MTMVNLAPCVCTVTIPLKAFSPVRGDEDDGAGTCEDRKDESLEVDVEEVEEEKEEDGCDPATIVGFEDKEVPHEVDKEEDEDVAVPPLSAPAGRTATYDCRIDSIVAICRNEKKRSSSDSFTTTWC